MVDVGDVAAVAAVITRVVCDADRAARLADNGIRLAARAGWARRGGEFVALCERLAGEPDR